MSSSARSPFAHSPSADWLRPVTLGGSFVRLEPLSPAHLPGLVEVGLDPELWRWTLSAIHTPEQMSGYLDQALSAAERGEELPFATVDLRSGRIVGSTRYLAIVPQHRRLEIGYTWVAREWQRSAVNTEVKLVMLRHAFDGLGCNRVEFKTDSLNEKSRRALIGIGAREEGTLRNHMVTQGGRIRHTVYYSVVADEWPAVRAHLEARLARNVGG